MPRKTKNKSQNSTETETGSNLKKHNVYVLKLEDGKRYVGRTGNLPKRMNQHFNGNGAEYTKKYKPIQIIHTNECNSLESSKAAERILYKRMRDCHGKDNVRGAGHTKST